MSVDSHSGTRDLSCPLCNTAVAPTSSACPSCHLPFADVRRHAGTSAASRGRGMARAVRVRVSGIVLYAAAVAWCAYALPTSLPFVVPGAVLGGGLLHVWKGRPWLGLILFTIIVVAVPALFWPSMSTGLFSELTKDL